MSGKRDIYGLNLNSLWQNIHDLVGLDEDKLCGNVVPASGSQPAVKVMFRLKGVAELRSVLGQVDLAGLRAWQCEMSAYSLSFLLIYSSLPLFLH